MDTRTEARMKLEELAENLEMEEDEFIEMTDLFVKTCLSDLIKLQAALEKGETLRVAKYAHSIKGAAMNLGFTEIFDAAKKMEMEARDDRLNDAAEMVKKIKAEVDRITAILARSLVQQ
jgi:HPt (histidine-containing phosphotransfer) domain-containing protein